MMRLRRSLFRDHQPQKHHRRSTRPSQYHRRPTFENLERRTLLAATLINTPLWAERGPGPITNSPFVDLDGNGSTGDSADIAVGAVQAIAVDPSNLNHVFIGTVNGGIWRTFNFNDANPNWTTATDQLPSLAIGAVAINPANTNHIYAGTGRFSSAGDGGSAVGLYRSFDGGATWTQIGFDTFHGLRIHRIIPTTANASGDTLFVSTEAADSRPGDPTGGIYRSDDSGVTWRRLSGTAATGLPNAPVSDLVSFTTNANTIGFYSAVPGHPDLRSGIHTTPAIFRSLDNGNTWQSITNNLANSNSINETSHIYLSVSQAPGKPVYAGLSVGGVLINVFRSILGTNGIDNNGNGQIDEPAEASWTAFNPPPPSTQVDDQDVQHLGILADSTLNDVVYVSGTATDGTGNLLRGSSSSGLWTSLTQTGANNTAPHPDVRDMVFSGLNILRAESRNARAYSRSTPSLSNFPARHVATRMRTCSSRSMNSRSFSLSRTRCAVAASASPPVTTASARRAAASASGHFCSRSS
jgi:hypothetical protein